MVKEEKQENRGSVEFQVFSFTTLEIDTDKMVHQFLYNYISDRDNKVIHIQLS
jgi:hypothetical protein